MGYVGLLTGPGQNGGQGVGWPGGQYRVTATGGFSLLLLKD